MTASDVLFAFGIPCLAIVALVASIGRHKRFRVWIGQRHVGQLILYCLGMVLVAAFFGLWGNNWMTSAWSPEDVWDWLLAGSILAITAAAGYRFFAALWFWFEARTHK